MLFIGLGNPGKQYAQTRHNVGFMVIDAFHAAHAAEFSPWQKKFNTEISEGRINGQKITLMKPQTFMNNSGESVAVAVGFWKLHPTTDLCLIYDDLDLPLGTIRVRSEGSSGGHNGVKSIISSLGTQAIPRIRLGIDTERSQTVPAEDFVLEKFTADELPLITNAVQQAVEEIKKRVQVK